MDINELSFVERVALRHGLRMVQSGMESIAEAYGIDDDVLEEYWYEILIQLFYEHGWIEEYAKGEG